MKKDLIGLQDTHQDRLLLFFSLTRICMMNFMCSCDIRSQLTGNVARTPSRKWELNCNWLTAVKECGSILSSRLWGGALRDDTKKGCVAD